MKRFQFPYERVMEWRDRRAELEAVELQRLHGIRSELAESLAQVGATIHAAITPPGQGHLTDGSDLQHAAAYVQSLRAREQTLATSHEECHAAIGKQLSVCVEADRDHELLRRLRDRKLALWRGEFYRDSEQSAADTWMAGRSRIIGAGRRHS